MSASEKPLRILVVVNLPWDSRLGATRVWIELSDQWRAAGHTVEKFSLSDAFTDTRAVPVRFSLLQILFPYRAAKFVRENADRFDVIDALIGTLPFSKDNLRFSGLLVARSVGLYSFYHQFAQSIAKRWAKHPKGKFLGRLLYRFTDQRLISAAERSIRCADLVNVPNEEEATSLQQEFAGIAPIIVQPYGLTAERKAALSSAAMAPESRLAEKRICFIGMWGPRKGAYDWPHIIAQVRGEIPDAKFRFLGTMIGADAVHRDLEASAGSGVELISDYQPDDLPGLLSDCTVGAFPSYVEGFGLAVTEQLAAGIPTVAYDTPGPADILRRGVPELLVQSGDINALVKEICRVLRSSPAEYGKLAGRCRAIEFFWPTIARETLDAYHTALRSVTQPIVFVQPFSIGSAGGGARILRALLERAPGAWCSICTSPEKPRPWRHETHLPSRRYWGRVEHSRVAGLPMSTARFFAPAFRAKLRACCTRLKAGAIHTVPHAGVDFSAAQEVAHELGVPLFLSVHDDLAYTAAGVASASSREAAMRAAWNAASARFVISDSLGEEYCRRYGQHSYQVVTDGLTQVHVPRAVTSHARLHIYFMGLFHMAYERNLRALLDALAILKREEPALDVTVLLRCEHVRAHVTAGEIPVKVLPFGDEAQVQRDMETADLLYMPLHFGDEHANFARYSLSTKMVTYIGSGLPILYHGPDNSAAYSLLSKHRSAITITTLAPDEIASALRGLDPQTRHEVAANAAALAERDFMLTSQTERFWGTIGREMGRA